MEDIAVRATSLYGMNYIICKLYSHANPGVIEAWSSYIFSRKSSRF